MDLSVGPLFAATLVRVSNREHVLILALDHMIGDSVSEGIVSREIWALYDQAVQGLPFSLAQLTVEFGDYAIWQQQAHSAWLKKHEAYWKERFADAPSVEIPVDNALADWEHLTPAMMRISFGYTLSSRLRDLARREGTLLSLVVLTVYVSVMSRWCNQSDLTVLIPSSGRNCRELRNMVGFLASGLYIRISVAKEDSLIDVLNRIRLEFDTALSHQPFDWVVGLIPVRTELIFSWLPNSRARWAASYQIGNDYEIRIKDFPLKLALRSKAFGGVFSDTEAGIDVDVHYQPDIVEPSTIDRFGSDLRLVAEELTQRPLARVGSVSIRTS